MIRFVSLPVVSTRREGWRTDAAKRGMIRFVEIAVFSGVQRLFSIRKATDSIVKVRTIRFVGLPFVFASRADLPTESPFRPLRFLLVCVVFTVTF
jgi:hypothetical protein